MCGVSRVNTYNNKLTGTPKNLPIKRVHSHAEQSEPNKINHAMRNHR